MSDTDNFKSYFACNIALNFVLCEDFLIMYMYIFKFSFRLFDTMSSATECPSCGSSDIITDDCGGHSQVVCTQCGQVIDQGSFQNEDDTFQPCQTSFCPTSGPNSGIHSAAWKSHLKPGGADSDGGGISKNKREASSEAHKLCKVQGLSNNMTKEVVVLFERAYSLPQFLHRPMPLKRALSGACFYIVCRLHSWPILSRTVASAFQTSLSNIFKIFQILLKEFDIDVPFRDMESLITSVLLTYAITDKEIKQKTVRLCELAKDTWISCGRNNEPLIMAAAFISWCSLGHGKHFAQFRKVCRGNVPYSSTRIRVKELREVIMTLAKQIPWISAKKCTANNVPFILDDVLNNKKMLMSKVAKSVPESDLNVDHANGDAFITARFENKRKRPSSRDTGDDDERDGKVMRVLDPEHDLNAVELTECDLPNSEMNEYVRTAEEVKERENMLKMIGEDEKEEEDVVVEEEEGVEEEEVEDEEIDEDETD